MNGETPEVWIGLINVQPKPGCAARFNGPGAYTSMLALARSRDEFVGKVVAACDDDDLLVIDMEDVEPLRERASRYEVSDDFARLASEAAKGRVVGGTFFGYLTDDEADD